MTTIIAPPWELPAEPITELPMRKKTEVFWGGLTGVSLAAGAGVNLITLLKGLPTPQYGTLAPFFNTASNKMNVYNDNASLTFKLNMAGSWSGGGATARSMQLDFVGTNGNRLVALRDATTTTAALTMATFFSVDKNGVLVNNGTTVTVMSNNGTFTVTSILLIAEQVTLETNISAV